MNLFCSVYEILKTSLNLFPLAFMPTLDKKLKAARAAFGTSIDCGITFFDTAEVYGSKVRKIAPIDSLFDSLFHFIILSVNSLSGLFWCHKFRNSIRKVHSGSWNLIVIH